MGTLLCISFVVTGVNAVLSQWGKVRFDASHERLHSWKAISVSIVFYIDVTDSMIIPSPWRT